MTQIERGKIGHVQRRDAGYIGKSTLKMEEKRKPKEEVYRCGDGGHAGGWCD